MPVVTAIFDLYRRTLSVSMSEIIPSSVLDLITQPNEVSLSFFSDIVVALEK
jgi:hypothetical protein